MTSNTKNNKKTDEIKKSLVTLLNQLKEQRRIATDIEPYMYNGDVLGPYAHIGDLKALNKGIDVLMSLIIDFESVDDFNSVKKLREAELFFSKNDVLKSFTFSNYKSQINPVFQAYVDIEIQLDALFKKSADLFYRGHHLAGHEAKGLVSDLKNLNRWYFEEKRMDYDDYQSEALYIIQKARSELEKHRGYKKLLGNLTVLILTLGTAFIVNKALNGHYLFFQKTDSAKQLDKISQTLDSVSDLLPPPVRLQIIKGALNGNSK